jgi:phosphoribosylglycinamide formyltransferase 1
MGRDFSFTICCVVKRLAIFASGAGTNAENIIRYFQSNHETVVEIVCCNNPQAAVLQRVQKLHTPCLIFNKKDFYESEKIETFLLDLKIDLIVLAGFLWLLPEKLVKAFPHKIINIHPALLPKFGGKGFYGSKVHEAVLESGENISGITVHYVSDRFDEGEIIAQFTCAVNENDTTGTLAARIQELEYRHYPKVIEQLLEKINVD